MLKLVEEVAIDAKPDRVFEVIADFSNYSRWNPWIVEAAGAAKEGAELVVKVKLRGRTQTVRHRILAYRPGVEFRWCDLGWFTVLAYGERARFLAPRGPNGTSYRVELRITGVLSGLVASVLEQTLCEGLRAETIALKARAEALGAHQELRAVS